MMGILPFDPSVLRLHVLVWPMLFGFGAYLLLTAQPIGRPKPDLAERLPLAPNESGSSPFPSAAPTPEAPVQTNGAAPAAPAPVACLCV